MKTFKMTPRARAHARHRAHRIIIIIIMVVASGQTYLITNKKSRTVCDLSGKDQKTVIGYTPQSSDNQKARVRFSSF